jgi:hypothetical protein
MKKALLFLIICICISSFSNAQGIVRGKVSDKNGETLIGVIIVLKSNKSIGVNTDLDGNYSLKITDSTAQTIVVSYVSYKTIEEVVHPVNGEIIIKDFVLESASQDLGVVEIVAKSTKAKEYYMENLKKNSSTTIDYISSETMKTTGDANVSTAVARVPGVSTNSGGMITVRGIGDRYVKTTINGSRIPTLDPYTNNIKLDIFPSSLIDNIIISKTASPDLPGDWAGAYLSIETKDYPEQLSINVESSFGYNNQSTFKDVLTSQRSDTDWLGFDSGLRSYNHRDYSGVNPAPDKFQELVALGLGDYFNSLGVNNQNWNSSNEVAKTNYKLGLIQLGLLAVSEFNNEEAYLAADDSYYKGSYASKAFKIINADGVKSNQAFPNNWDVSYRKAPINFSQSFSIGNQTQLFGKPLGILAGFRYGTTTQYDPNAKANRAAVDSILPITNRITEQASKESNTWSALLNLAYKFNTNNSIALLFMPNFSGTNSVRYNSDNVDPINLQQNKDQIYEQRKQLIYQLKTEHYIPGPKLKIELKASYTNGNSTVPDFKRLSYGYDINSKVYNLGQVVNRSYRYLTENIFDSQLSAELPLGDTPGLNRKLKFGVSYLDNSRDGQQHQYGTLNGAAGAFALEGDKLEEYFSFDNFGFTSTVNQYGVTTTSFPLYYTKTAYPSDHIIGFSKIKAAYVMLDYTLIPSLRLAGGLRVENAAIFADAYEYNKQGYEADDARRKPPTAFLKLTPANLNKTSFLPSFNVIYKLTKNEEAPMNLRANFSKTVARPSIRELTNTDVYDFELRAFVYGDSELKIVDILNYDLRLEKYFKNGDNVSLSLFYKDFKNHIEIAEAPATNALGYTWINVDKSWVKGLEFEAKKRLTKRFELRTNITLVESKTSFLQKSFSVNYITGVKTYSKGFNVTRPMFGQSPYIINGIFGYKEDSLGLGISVSYNVQGPRLVLSSPIKILQVYELPRHTIDIKATKTLGKHFGVSLTVRDILNAPIRRSYNFDEGFVVDYDKYRFGTNFLLAFSYKL